MSGDPTPDLFPGPREVRGQRYTCVATRPYQRRDGCQTMIATWESRCAECGEPFTFTVPMLATKFEPNRRCRKHKRPGQRVARTQPRPIAGGLA